MANCPHDPDYVENDEVTADEHDRECLSGVSPIGTTTGLFPVTKSRAWKADYFSQYGREDEAFERDE